MRSRGLTRRALLRGMCGAAISLPLLDAMRGGGRRARAQAAQAPRRFVVFYTPNGTVPTRFWPTGSGSSFTLSPILAPLERHKRELLVVGGVDLTSSMNGPGDAHQKGTGQCLTATELQEGAFPGDAGRSAGWADGISVDQAIAAAIGGDTIFPSLELGVMVQGSDVRSRISYRGPGQPVPPENSPYAVYERLFGDTSADPAQLARTRDQRGAVLDLVAEEYRRLAGRLGAADRQKVEAHLLAIQAIQTRLARGQIALGGQCQPIDQGAPIDVGRVANLPLIGQLQMDLLAMAFACDATRVASLMWTWSTATHVFSWLGSDLTEGHHAIAHKGDQDTVKVAQNTRINGWYAEQLASLIDRLKALPEGDGTVFDRTVILWTNEQAHGNNHDRTNMPYVLAGSAGGILRTGRYVVQPQGTPHNRLLVSLLNAMGVETDTFGNPAYGSGALSGLT